MKFKPSGGQGTLLAHIGPGVQRRGLIADGESPVYQTRWSCYDTRNGMAFVDGGMSFNQSDQSLYVPKCGYYYVSSQVYFQVSEAQTRSVFHQLNIRRSCATRTNIPDITLKGYSSTGHVQPANGESTATSTYVADIVMLCRGSRIWVTIPDNPDSMPCCPYGQETHLQAFLVAETSCSWPPVITMTTNL